MGCPPDPVEVSIWRSADRISELESRYRTFIAEYAEAAALAHAWHLDFTDIAQRHVYEPFTRRTDMQATEYDQYADATAQSQLEDKYARLVKELETELCILRTRLMNLAREKPQLTESAAAAYERVRAGHSTHREEDRALAIAWLRRQCEILEFYTRDANTGESRIDAGECKNRLVRAQKEIARLTQVPIENLIHDRSLTAIDERQFELPFRE